MNTNWGYKWTGSRVSPCSDNFPGTEAFQSVEARAMSDYLTNGTILDDDEDDYFKGEPTPAPNPGRRRVRAFVDLHSYGQLCESPPVLFCFAILGKKWVGGADDSHVPIRILL
jgi:hypothetical protein